MNRHERRREKAKADWWEVRPAGKYTDLEDPHARHLLVSIFRSMNSFPDMDDQEVFDAHMHLIDMGYIKVRIRDLAQGTEVKWDIDIPEELYGELKGYFGIGATVQ